MLGLTDWQSKWMDDYCDHILITVIKFIIILKLCWYIVTGQSEFAAYLKKEYCHENIRFVEAVQKLRWGPTSNMNEKVKSIYE